MQAHENNLVMLNVNSVQNTITSFLSYKGKNPNTYESYRKDIDDFFRLTRNKDVSQVTYWTDKDSKIDKKCDLYYVIGDVVAYRDTLQSLKDKKGNAMYKNKSINRKISTIRNLFEYFKMNDYDVNPFSFKIDDLSEKDSVGSDYLSEVELNKLIELAKTKKSGEEKSLFFRLAYITAVRLKALSELTWGNIVLEENDHIISVYDKGEKLDEKYIGEELYNQLSQLKQEHRDEDKVFQLSFRTFQDEVPKLAKELGFCDKRRKITFHSIRKSSGVHVYEETGDAELTRQHMNHSSMEVTFKNYVNIKRDYTKTGSYILAKKKKDTNKMIDEINDLDMLKEILKQCSEKTKNEILSKLNG